jgi:hypothetical protein
MKTKRRKHPPKIDWDNAELVKVAGGITALGAA